MIALKNYEAIIFDLGGVILNIDYNLTIQAFKKLGIQDFDKMYGKMSQSGLFDLLETGRIEPREFRSKLHKQLPKTTLEDINKAWNAMILDFPPERIEMLKQIRKGWKTFLLSNTNEIHLLEYTRRLKVSIGHSSLTELFDHVFLSHEVQMRKPDVEIFQFVISHQKLDPEKTLFIDDSPQHIEGAKKAGIHAYHLKDDERIEDLLEM